MSEKKKSIAFLCAKGDSLIRFRGELIKQFLIRDYTVHALASEIDPVYMTELKSLGVKFHTISLRRKSLNPFHAVSDLINIFKVIRSIKPSIIFSYTHKSVIIGAFAGFLNHIPTRCSLITGTGHIFERETFKKKLVSLMACYVFKIALKLSTNVIFQNKDDKKLFIDFNLVKDECSYVVNGSGVDLNYFQEEDLPDELSVICLTRLIKSKGVWEYAKTSKEVKKLIPNAKFYLAGFADDHEDSISEEEIKNEWSEKYGIEYLGFFSDPREAIRMASVYVLLSYNEGTPRSVLEAMSMGRPIVTTDVAGCRETVKDGINGYLVPDKNIQEPIKKITLLADAKLRKTMGRESRLYCVEKYDVHKVNKEILNIMQINKL